MFFFLILFFGLANAADKPQQVHLSFIGDSTQMTVTWITMHNVTLPAFVAYGTAANKLSLNSTASQTGWHDLTQVERYTYRATMTNLKPGITYYYSVGSSDQMSNVFHFKAIDPKESLKVCIYGDFGLKNGYSLDALINGTKRGFFDIVIHIGDISYNLDSDAGVVGDKFMNEIQPIAAYVPYMVIAGNHEYDQDFLHYRQRFTMPPNGVLEDNQFWSITIGNSQFIGISTEYYGYEEKAKAQKQYNWLVSTLKASKAIWKFVFMHRPMYCASHDANGCQARENKMTRNGENGLPALEPIFNSGAVDMVFWGHQHTYERNWPVYESKAYTQGQTAQHYHNSTTPVYILTGSAGCHDHDTVAGKIKQPYTNVMLGQYGYSVMQIASDSQVVTTFIDISQTNNPLDKFYLTKDPNFKTGRNFIKPL